MHDKSGKAEKHHTSIHTPNKYLENIVSSYDNTFKMAPSIHPYKKTAIEEIEYYHRKYQIKIVKWLPNSMFIDPSDPICDSFYHKLIELNIFLLTHTGQEHSLDGMCI